MAAARNMLVINDEAHHAWRVPAESKVKGVEQGRHRRGDEVDRRAGPNPPRPGGSCAATTSPPRRLCRRGKQSVEEALFEWIVSDFGLNDAIESGLVKTPRVVVRDDGRLTASTRSGCTTSTTTRRLRTT